MSTLILWVSSIVAYHTIRVALSAHVTWVCDDVKSLTRAVESIHVGNKRTLVLCRLRRILDTNVRSHTEAILLGVWLADTELSMDSRHQRCSRLSASRRHYSEYHVVVMTHQCARSSPALFIWTCWRSNHFTAMVKTTRPGSLIDMDDIIPHKIYQNREDIDTSVRRAFSGVFIVWNRSIVSVN